MSSSTSSPIPEDISDDNLRAEFAASLPDFALPPILPHTRSLLLDKIRKVKKDRKEGDKEERSKWEGQLRSILKTVPKTPKSGSVPVTENENGEECEVSNYVFLDLEATGLASANPRTRITELSMVAVTKAQFGTLRRNLEQLKYKSDPEAITPRALNKLTLCFDPQTQIPPLVASLTGLDNCILEDQGHFDTDAVEQIKGFLRRLAKPICLVAHNGKVFDFPLFVAEVMGCGGAAEDADLICMDSLATLKSIYEKELRMVDAEIAGVEAISALGAFDDDDDFGEEAGVSKMEWDEGGEASRYHSALSSPAARSDSHNYHLPNTPPKSDPFEHAVSSPPVVHSFQSPDSSSTVLHMDGAQASTTGPGSDGDEEVTPERPIIAPDAPPPLSPKANKRAKLKRQNKQAEPTASTAAKSARKRLDFGAPQSYSLPRLHEHLFGRVPAVSHGAEADCLALMRVCAVKGVRATKKSPGCFNLSAIKPMW